MFPHDSEIPTRLPYVRQQNGKRVEKEIKFEPVLLRAEI